MIVVDTSVLIDFLRGKSTKKALIFRRIEEKGIPFSIPLMCAQELLQGARDGKDYNSLRSYLITQDLLIPKDPVTTHFEAARIYFDCRRKGITPRSTIDCIIVQLVIENNGELLHSDKDFEEIAVVRKFLRVES